MEVCQRIVGARGRDFHDFRTRINNYSVLGYALLAARIRYIHAS